MSEDEEEVKEILKQGDTAIIYPEAPEDDQSPAETGGADENGNIYTYKHIFSVHIYLVSQSPSNWNQNIVFVWRPKHYKSKRHSNICIYIFFFLTQGRRTPSPSCTHARTAPEATSATPR